MRSCTTWADRGDASDIDSVAQNVDRDLDVNRIQ